jgi:pimeloyl-ACP methyl ester carboxylesterase
VVVALHGAGLSAGCFDGQALPTLSLMTPGASLGFTVLAVDRPGYGRSAAGLPGGQTEPLGLDISGCGHRYAVEPSELPTSGSRGEWAKSWGPLRLYPPNTFKFSGGMVAQEPVSERQDAERWPEVFPSPAARVRVPIRFTFAEHESC